MNKKEKEFDFASHLNEYGVVGCVLKVVVVPPSVVYHLDDNERCWTLYIDQQGDRGRSGVGVAWYKTRAAARQHAKLLRKALKQLTV